jgi:Cys-tRNA(Pro) deacylase
MDANVRGVVDAARAAGVEIEPRAFPASTRTAAEAADTIGVAPGQIVKSLVFAVDGEVVMALVGGDRTLDEAKLAAAVGGARCERVDAASVREATGYAIGGVPPFGHRRSLRVFVDEGLLAFDVLWAAAGSPHTNFPIGPADLVRASGGVVCDVAGR